MEYNSTFQDASLSHAFGYDDPQHNQQISSYYNYQQQPSVYGGAPPHVMCLKLGKRQYFEDMTSSTTSDGSTELPAVKCGRTVARCSVDGCDVSLVNSKEYYRRHKVCEMHSKAPRVTILGLELRFCQQCSRFHGISEFDDAKRSCRRRLAGHNERRRKTSHDSTVKNPSHAFALECVHSHLSQKSDHRPWVCPPDFSLRSSAALSELIAENRASIVARQQMYHHLSHKTLDLMQAKEEHEGERYEGWNNSLEGTLMM